MTFDASSLSIFALQMKVDHLALEMMLRGIEINIDTLRQLEEEVAYEKAKRFEVIQRWLPQATEKLPNSPKQMKELFEALGLKAGIDRKTKRPTYDNEVLFARSKTFPKYKEMLWAIMEWRTLDKMRSNFIESKLDPDGRMRSSLNTAGPETFRWSSSKNPWGRGTNLQNVAKPFHNLTGTRLPNLRRSIVPSGGSLLWEPDLKGADAQIVAWDSGDEVMKQFFREGRKLHAERAKMIFGAVAGPDGKTEPYYTLAKKAGHLWAYGGKARTMAMSIGQTIAETEKIIKRLEAIHPAIPKWHRRVEDEVVRTRTIRNAFGYRIVYLGRTDDVLPDALAWIGQGTVAIIANKVALNIRHNVPTAILLLQEHDSLVGESIITEWDTTAPLIREQFMRVVVPYPDPLVITPSLKTSAISWGDMEESEFD